MQEILFWIYFANTIFLINHQIDSAYWKEWNLINPEEDDQKGINGFLILHFPLLFIILFGLVEVYKKTFTGLIFSLVLCACGFFCITFHMYFIKKRGRKEFNVPVSLFLIFGTFALSLFQFIITIYEVMHR